MAPKRDREAFAVGDLVWTKVGSYPFWPGQVMDPETAPEKVKRTYRKGRLLVSFFGDNTHGYYMPAQLRSFDKHVQRYRQGFDASAKDSSWRASFTLAVEQAEELAARRLGKEPATSHHPLDFKVEAPVYDVEYGNVGFAVRDIYRPIRPSDVENYDVAEAFKVLQQAARNIDCMPVDYSDSIRQPSEQQKRNVPEVSYDDLHKAGRFLVWRNFHKLPVDIQKDVCKSEVGWSPQAELKAAAEAAKAAEKAATSRKVPEKRRRTKEVKSADDASEGDIDHVNDEDKDAKEELSEDEAPPPRPRKSKQSKQTKLKREKPEKSEADEEKPELLDFEEEAKVPEPFEDEFDGHNDEDADVKHEGDETFQGGKTGGKAAARGKGSKAKSAQGKGRSKGGSGPLGAELWGGATVKKQRAPKGAGKGGKGGKAGAKGAGSKGKKKIDKDMQIEEDDHGDNDPEQDLGQQAIGSILSKPGTSLPWPQEVSIHAVQSESALVKMSKPVPEEIPGLEELAVQCGVQLHKGKVALKKILARLRQYSRGHHNAPAILNPQNVAAMHKLSHLMRMMKTNYTSPDPAQGAAQCTRDEQVRAWRHSMEYEIQRWQNAHAQYKEMQEKGALPEDAKPPPADPPPAPPPEPDTEFMNASPPRLICLAQNVYVPMHAYRHLKCIQGDEEVLLHTLRAFWRSRGTVLPKLEGLDHAIELDIPEVLKQVSRRGGFWCTCAIQGDGSAMHTFEHMHSWQKLVRLCWLTEDKPELSLAHAAAQLQSYYYTWLLPFERWIMHEYHACTATARVPALLVRRLGFDRGDDSALTYTVKFFCAASQGTTGEGYTQCVAGRHDLTLDDALGIFEAAMGPLLSDDAVRDLSRSFSSTFAAKRSSSGSSAEPPKPPPNPSLAAHTTLDDIIPQTCSGQPELANTLMHVHACEVATGEPMNTDAADVSTLLSHLEPVKRAKRSRGSGSGGAPMEGGLVSESDEEAAGGMGGSDEEGGRKWGMEEQDERAQEHMHAPRSHRQRGRPSITARGRSGAAKRKREAPPPSPSLELSSDGADDMDEDEQPVDSADEISEDEQPKKKRSKAAKAPKKTTAATSKASASKADAAAPTARRAGTARRSTRTKKAKASSHEAENDADIKENAKGADPLGSMHSDPSGGATGTLEARTAPSDSGAARSAQDHDSHASAQNVQTDVLGDAKAHADNNNNNAENNSLDAKESLEIPEVSEPKPVNKFKRQLGANRGLKREKDDTAAGNRHRTDKPWCTQFDFDARYPKISESRIRQAVEKCRLLLVSHECSTLAGGKSVVLYFATRSDAERAAKELPGVVRRLEQKTAAYSIEAAVMKYNDAQSRIRAAKEHREQQLLQPLDAVAGAAGAGSTAASAASAAAAIAAGGGSAAAAAATPQEQQQPHQVVILQAPTGFPTQGYVQGNPNIVLAPAGMQQPPATEGAVPSMYPQATTYSAPSPTAVAAYPTTTQYVTMDSAAAGAAAAQGMPLVATGTPGAPVATIADGSVGFDELQAILNAADSVKAAAPPAGGLMAPPPDTRTEGSRGEDTFLDVLESLRGGVV